MEKAITEPVSRDLPNSARLWLARQQSTVRPFLIGVVIAGLVNALAFICLAGLLATVIQRTLIDGQALSAQSGPAIGLIVAVAVRAISQAAQERFGQLASARVRQRVRSELLDEWAVQGPVQLAGRASATLANHWVEQVEALDGYFARYLPQQWLALLVPLTILAVVFWLDWLAALFLLIAAPLIPLFMALIGMSAERLSQQHVHEAGRLAGHFLDRVRSLTSLQLFGQVEQASAGVTHAAERYRAVTMRTLRVAFLSSAVLEFFASVAIAVVAMYIGFGLLGYIDFGPSPQLTLFSGLFVLLLAPEFFQPLRNLAQHYHDRAAALGAADALVGLSPAVDSEQTYRRVVSMSPRTDHVTVDRVKVGYSGRSAVLEDVSFSISRGDVVALVGPSGSGKSTLLSCLAGFIQPQAGHITLFGQAPGAEPVAWLGQRPFLIKGSWADNLRLIAPDADIAAMLTAVEAVGLKDVVAAQPHGLATPLGEGGRGLSGGQAQRLALARVWLIDAELVLLDEPTASLDPNSEAEVIEALLALARSGRTILIATHHPAIVAIANRTLRLHAGRLVDE
ncbi:thiol reductant ABC exporter subunit CydD [Pseudomonas saliphila]|uniref:thiol reductant ABC exporter subunit CydD n=1 Tax=Pseudomonas saliphila TaxID=2586906 RepID=UPI0015B4A145|nr:thiol reductant ABC exporter subunit CydD [Pseudomonas saliphila]